MSRGNKTRIEPSLISSAGLVGTDLSVNVRISEEREGGRAGWGDSREPAHVGSVARQGAAGFRQRGRSKEAAGTREPHPALAKASGKAVLGQRSKARQVAARLAPKRLGAADLREAAGGEITAAPWQRADIHQN